MSHRHCLTAALLFALSGVSFAWVDDASTLRLVPFPREVRLEQGTSDLKRSLILQAPGGLERRIDLDLHSRFGLCRDGRNQALDMLSGPSITPGIQDMAGPNKRYPSLLQVGDGSNNFGMAHVTIRIIVLIHQQNPRML